MTRGRAISPITVAIEQHGVLILDGGLATELEARGASLDDGLWSARLLIDDPDLVRAVHLDYLEAGADCLISASYQATFAGFRKRGIAEAAAAELIRSSVSIATSARDTFWETGGQHADRVRPIVAASVGPYGAFLADGSEYTGRYHLDRAGLLAFHRKRWHLLAASGADLLACETIPSRVETEVLLQLLHETADVCAWFSFSCRDERRLSDGTPIADIAALFRDQPQVIAVGANCTAPRFIPGLIRAFQAGAAKPVVVYPNSGERFDGDSRSWIGEAAPVDFGELAQKWRAAGATLIGGCCRTGPDHIRSIRDRLAAC